jgi:small GTP-binding protein
MTADDFTGDEFDRHVEALKRIDACEAQGGNSLDLSNLRLSKIPPQIEKLTSLKSLILYNNAFEVFPHEIIKLQNLTKLEMGRNFLTELPIEIRDLKNLKSLSIWENQFQQFPLEILGLSQLSELFLDGNDLRVLPDQISRLDKLKILSASGCQISEISKGVCSLKNLAVLKLNRNYLSSLPVAIIRIRGLSKLELVRNKLSSLPFEMAEFEKLGALYLHGNVDLRIPASILGPTPYESHPPARPQDILNFYFSQRDAEASGTSTSLNEVKLMLVGRGGAGKTSLRRFFMGESHNRDEPETPGIGLDNFQLDCAQGPVSVRLWDFAGQEITHALHKFFLTEGCIYILVLDPRSNTEMHDAEYWLGLLKRYAGNAPVLVALNRQDARQGGYDVDRRVLKERFPFIHSFTATNCEQRDTCNALMKGLRDAVESLNDTEPPHLKVPQSWINVIEECDGESATKPKLGQKRIFPWLSFAKQQAPKSKGRQHMTLDEFREICSEHGESSLAKQESLARLLHKLGAVLHFVDEPRLRDTAVLNPHWVTDGVYRLLRFKDRPESDGTLSVKDALTALPGESEITARFLFRLMERFDMCFPLDDKENGELPTRWLVPGALGEFQPDSVGTDWQTRNGVRLRYVYDPLPEGVLPRFIVMTNLLSEGRPRWRNGVVLEDGLAKALVRRGEKRDYVEIIAVGPDEERLRLLEIIQGTLERIHVDLPDPKPVAEIEISGLPGIYRSVADLEVAEIGRQKVAVDTRGGKVLVEPTRQLNQASEPESRKVNKVPLRVFLSYSYKDRRSKDIFQDNLTVMMKKKLVSPWQDGLIEPGVRWYEDVEAGYAGVDVFIGLLTTAFLATDYLEKIDVRAARAELQEADRDILFVLILVDDVSLQGVDLTGYHILKPGGKSVSAYPSKKDGYNAAQKELEILLLQYQEKYGTQLVSSHNGVAIESGSNRQGITLIVQGDFVEGDKLMSSNHSVNITGDIHNSQIGQELSNCSILIAQQENLELREMLKNVERLTVELIDKVVGEDREEVKSNLELAVKAATANVPNRRWYSISTAGLLEASKFVTNINGELITHLAALGKWLWPDFQLPK